jgi:hypothetical protein
MHTINIYKYNHLLSYYKNKYNQFKKLTRNGKCYIEARQKSLFSSLIRLLRYKVFIEVKVDLQLIFT